MYSVTFIGTTAFRDETESVEIDGVTYDRDEAVEVKKLHPHIDGNPTFHVEKIKEEKEETEETPVKKVARAPRVKKTETVGK